MLGNTDEEEGDDAMDLDEKETKITSWKHLDDGQLEIVTNKRAILIDKRTADYLETKKMLRNLKLHPAGYICSNLTRLHMVIGDAFCETDAEVRAKYVEHFELHPTDTTSIMHLDDDKLNCTIGNLMRGPQMLNMYMRKSQPFRNGAKFVGFVTVGKKQEATKTLDSMAEVKHAMDILKIQKLPEYFRQFIFEHSMHKPAAYAEHYGSVEALMARASKYTKEARKPQKPRVSKNKYEVFRTLDEAHKKLTDEQMKIITAILDTAGVVPFDAAIDCIVLYTGSFGKKLIQLLEYACYKKHLEPTKPAMKTMDKYLQVKLTDGINFMHNVVLGRPLGQKARDGLEGGHGWGKTLDNRKRTLAPETRIENNSGRGQADDKSVPGVVGVTRTKNGTFHAQIGSFFERANKVYLGTYATVDEASAVYQFAAANKKALVALCKDMEDRNAEVRKRCVAKSL
jgi:hypothetical protein